MRLVTFLHNGHQAVGIADEMLTQVSPLPAEIAPDMLTLIANYDRLKDGLAAAAGAPLPIAGLQLLAPIPRPSRNVFCVGKNYHEHAKEFAGSGFDSSAKEVVPEAPVIFTKPSSTVIGPGASIPNYLDPTDSTDYEGELTVIIGRGGRGITKQDALAHVFGYTIINDVTARTLQHKHRQWFIGKGIDGFCPMGPAILTADEMPDPTKMQLKTYVNGELRQDASVADLIFDIPTLIECISSVITLEPGDLLATGTPAGVGLGFKPPRFLKKGDVVAIDVSGIGRLENPVG
ncbi:fumarylacetoacetate hydrolase family protein [Tardiphaga sp. vice352]|uniref:fumarylacetoacetate hydrolase family protein n=1 Tax=unclassified Tardiphaga TaxID=2631404 RepID=UPI0011649839|nr:MULTISPECIES: fumarylacetoacetate hydrolase family protein [unclassified Tardiphaga]MBC7582267.1 fumarylacetoacetate hydrolase family protein [Tardiphaga sp.]QDM17117.1 fumarylacetoacetate hydrolase family protein [Tardiphaga sp. vice278]QDM22096.1 fumarylacetoacetate hydrolase family protein [Tardiphaga sp. vice154]QDM27351.1 fumarylacetoacetate hydrolase family protein [Tardiphaga sp. vice304]QDM32477.1 fumarylacetoacetate hydrolase family protein [Tardiphaga sp. vice352]